MGLAALLIPVSEYPVEFICHWPGRTTNTDDVNFTARKSMNSSTVDCTYPMGYDTKKVAFTFIGVNLLSGTAVFMEIVYLLWKTLNDYSFCSDIEFCCVYLLRKRKRIRKVIKDIRENIPENSFNLHDDFGEEFCSYRALKDIYRNVTFLEGRERTIKRRFNCRRDTYKQHFNVLKAANIFTNAIDLFKFKSKSQTKAILVVGRPGIGKTLLTKHILYQWQKHESKFWHGKIVFLIRLRDFNRGETINLQDVLRHSEEPNTLVNFNHINEYIHFMPKNVVLIFDGLDELANDKCEQNTADCRNKVRDIFVILKQLVEGKLLPGVKVLVTSRPTAERIYKDLNFGRKVEIMGFDKEQIKKYVETFCYKDIDQSTKMWNFISESPELLSLCYLPVNSYIVCLTLKESIAKDEQEELAEGESNVPRTITDLYKRAIKILLYRHHLRYQDDKIPKDYMIAELPESLQSQLKKLKEIAWNGMIKDEITFKLDSGNELILTELSGCGLFNKLEDKRQNILCFLHLTIQEFLAALHVVDDMESVESFLSEHIDNPKLHLVIQFVAGLVGHKTKQARSASERYVLDIL